MENILFYFFSSLAILSGVMVIRSKNPVISVLFLILVFCNVAGLLILLELEFFAMLFLVVYVGAIAVLFLFVVMMLNIKLAEINENVLRYLPMGGIIGLIFLFELFLIVDNDLIPALPARSAQDDESLSSNLWTDFDPAFSYIQWATYTDQVTNIEAVGQVVYTYFCVFFILASIILLVAMIGAIVLTMHKGVAVKRQEIFEQNTREFTKTIQKIRS